MKKITLLALSLLFTINANAQLTKLYIDGSEAMFPAVNAIANEYKRTNPNGSKIDLKLTGHGSTSGFLSLLERQSNVVSSTRKATQQETEEFKDAGFQLKEFLVAKEAWTIVVSPDNPVYKLTKEQITDIFTGKIKNWKEVGGEDEAIRVFIHSNSAGCYYGFKQTFFNEADGEDYSSSALQVNSNYKIKESVLKYKNAISFLGYNSAVIQEKSLKRLKLLKVSLDQGKSYVSVNDMTIDSGEYKLVRNCYLYTTDKDYELVKPFIEFAKSEKSLSFWDISGFAAIK